MGDVMGQLTRLLDRYPSLEQCRDEVFAAYLTLESTVERDGLILVCGNGGSAADGDHIVGELMKGFSLRRPLNSDQRVAFLEQFPHEGSGLADNLQGAIRAISLTTHTALLTAFANDCEPEYTLAQQAWGYGRRGDSLICISTSGNSRNVVRAAQVARVIGMQVIGLTGEHGGTLRDLCDVTIRVPGGSTADVQEYHLPVYHALCLMLEQRFFAE